MKLTWTTYALVACLLPACSESDSAIPQTIPDLGDLGDVEDLSKPDLPESEMGAQDMGPDLANPQQLVDPECDQDGCIRDLQYSVRVSQAQLESLIEPGLEIQNGYQLFTVLYKTGDFESTATLAIPDGPVPPEGFGVVVNAHGTVGLDSLCRLSDTVSGAGLAGLFASRGTISIAPDYPGLGTAGLHPYLVSEVAGPAVLDSARAALLVAEYLEKPTSGRVALVGLSQGGHAVLTAASQAQTWAPELNVVAVAASGPASMYLEHWSPGLGFAGPHIVFPAMLMAAWRSYYNFSEEVLLEAAIPTIEAAASESCLWSPSLADIPLWYNRIPEDPSAIFDSEFLSEMAAQSFDRFQEIEIAFSQNRIVPFATTIPIQIWQGTADDVVLYTHTAELVDDLQAAGMTIDFQVVEGAGHVDLAFGFVAFQEMRTVESIEWIKGHLSD